MGALTLLVGGARSGKSSFAVEVGRSHDGEVVFVATAERVDADMTSRIDRHRAERPSWRTIEAPVDLAGAVSAAATDALVIVDCLTVWVGNLLHHGEEVDARLDAFLGALDVRVGRAVVVSNEVGMGVHPTTELGREFCDLLGHVNQRVARHAERTLLLVAGRALALREPNEALR
jgi:adenosylcobinamide kinase / adenosylcobinamide-phosphate guanylyltransferase